METLKGLDTDVVGNYLGSYLPLYVYKMSC